MSEEIKVLGEYVINVDMNTEPADRALLEFEKKLKTIEQRVAKLLSDVDKLNGTQAES